MASRGYLSLLLFLACMWKGTVAQNSPPIFNGGLSSVNLPENSPPGSFVYTVSAFDVDGDDVTYYISPDSLNADNFRVENDTGIVRVGSGAILDRETLTPNNQHLTLVVRATDGTTHAVADPAFTLLIILLDENDNSPIITNLPGTESFPENTNPGTELYTVTATDADFGANGLVFYEISDNTTLFSIERQTGTVSLEADLDYDDPTTREHTITIIARDQSSNVSLSDAETLTIAVTDINDRDPVFSANSYSVSVRENLTYGDVVTTVSAYDGDRGVDDDIVYSLEDGNELIGGNASFAIDNVTGVITVNVASLDRETHDMYTLRVKATESHDETRDATTTVTITIVDINDNLPMFEQSMYMGNVSEQAGIGTTVLQVVASDRDHGTNADFTFELEDLLNSSLPLPFSISHTGGVGSLTLNQTVDFEDVETYFIRVIAREVVDGTTRNGTTQVRVYVNNENDNNPLFERSEYNMTIPESANAGSFIQRVVATDGDKGSFGELQYRLVSGHFDDFNITTTDDGGLVRTAMSLDYEDISFYTIGIQATDTPASGMQPRTTQTVLHVTVLNLNDNPPVFNQTQLTVQLQEELAAGTLVAPLVVSDADGDDLTDRIFSITSGDDYGNFSFDSTLPNVLVTTTMLDYDMNPDLREWDLEITVNDTLFSDVARVRVQLQDVNDNTPVFGNTTYQFSVEEEVAVGTEVGVVVAEDADSNLLGQVSYILLDSEKFSINSSTGAISTKADIDREDSDSYTVTIVATDLDPLVTNRRTASVEATITIEDINDNAPEFSTDTYIFDIRENTPTISEDVRVSASDEDVGTNSQITYQLISGNTNNAFIVDPSTGGISRNASQTLDREEVARYDIVVLATDGGTVPHNTTAQIIINILDENDENPQFSESSYNATISEDIPTNSIVIQVTAEDRDTPENARLTYSITSVAGPSASPSGTFTIGENTGNIRTQGTFDREAFEGPYVVQVAVTDNGAELARNGSTMVTISLMDVNDNTPAFSPGTYTQTLSEAQPAGLPVVTVTASDRDVGTNQEISYSISEVFALNNVDLQVPYDFAINSSSGEVVTNVSLDYELVQRYRITVLATDRGANQRSSSATITVTVNDVNDHTPQFSEPSYTVQVSEDTLRNSRFSVLDVSDQDSGENSRITYSADITTPFRVDPDTGELVVTDTLDYELTTNYTFTVNASDNGVDPRVTSASVTVMVQDVNDNAPVFLNDSYSETIPEDNYSTSSLLLATVEARDVDTGAFGSVTYQLVSGNSDLFSLNNVTGEVTVYSNVDFEALSSSPDATSLEMQLIIQANDGGSPSMSSSVTLVVTITDVNDNRPMFAEASYSGSVREGSSPGQEVVVVQAVDSDPDQNGLVRYSLRASDTADFSIDEVTGEITTGMAGAPANSSLYDYETTRMYNLEVTASDNGSTPQTAPVSVVVFILDANDNPPVITDISPSSVSLSEGTAVMMLVSQVSVTDRDSGDNAEVEYQLSNDGGQFRVSADGDITLAEPLDRESVDYYNITITVTDGGQPRNTDVAYLEVTVADINDNTPSFAQDSYTALVLENVTLNSVVATLRVQDRDIGDNGRLQFTVVSGDTSAFSLQERQLSNGWWEVDLLNQITFDYETGARFYMLEVQARDSSPPSHSTLTNITITILDVNDNTPAFSSASYTLQVSESMPVSGVVGSVLANDPDGASNGMVSYSFAAGTENTIISTFSLHPSTGVITLLSALNFETTQSYSFTVVATDGGSPTLSSNATVIVEVQDVNEFSPVFEMEEYTASVGENQPSPLFVIRVNATEPESAGVSGSIRYQIVTGSDSDFSLDPVTGVLTTTRALDREQVARYVLTIQASDSGGVSRTGYAQLTVTVTDENDNSPAFSASSHTYLLPENSPLGTALTPTQLASDPDEGTNSDLRYSLSPSNSPFVVDSVSGVVSVAGQLNRETTPSYTLSLVATDQGPGQRTDSIDLIITLTDVNDNDPEFDANSYSGSVDEGSPSGVAILQVSASDEDATDTITYSIAAGDPLNQFSIGSTSGTITTGATPLDRETDSSYTLTIRATDSGLRADEVEVEVTVDDRNDNVPEFSSPSFTVSVDEGNSGDQVVTTVTAQDGDLGNNGIVHYSIIGGNGLGVFSIPDAASGEVVARAGGLDYETQSAHYLTIQATDQASPSTLRLSSTALLTVIVQDTNDNRAVFSQDPYRATVREDAAIDTTVIVISATDADSGSNGDLLFSFQTATSVFSINSTTGVVVVTGQLNFENVPEYDLIVLARDRGNPVRSSVADLHIDVVNINDNSPRFTVSFYTAEVAEDASPSTSVLRVVATDPDNLDPNSLTYSITDSSNTNGYFLIDGMTGLISTARSLDRETVAVVNLLVVAEDPDNQNGTATVQVTVTDVNDNAPQFTSPSYTASIRENSVAGTTLIPFFGGNSTRVEAVDSDGPGLNSEVSYDKDGEDRDLFSVDKDTGIVTVAPGAVLDREVDDILELVITAEDHGTPEMTSSVTMTITLLDANDNPPTFIPQFGYAVEVAEDTPAGSVLPVPVAASDPDLGESGAVTFLLSSSSPLSKLSSFSINRTSGEITLLQGLDREEDPLIVLTISAQDNGVPTLVSSTSVQITVTDINDNGPQFSEDPYITTVPEYLTVGGSAIRVSAVDPDSGTNGQVVYEVISSNSPFTVNRDTGVVTTTAALDYETQDRYTITVQACDEAVVRNCSEAQVIVNIADFNDEIPLFDFSSYRTDVCSSTAANTDIMQMAATDRDSGSNAEVTYSITGDVTGLLGVWPVTDLLYLTRDVEPEEVGSEVTATVVATDGGSPSLSGSTQVVVRLLNCTADPLRFDRPYYSFGTFEHDALGGSVGVQVTFGALTILPTLPGDVQFNPALPDNPFELIANVLTAPTRESFDREVRDVYVLPVMTTLNQETAYTTVTVRITDLNDESPQFQLTALSFSVLENETAPVTVATLLATDNDIGTNAEVVYSITPTNPYFTIDNMTGVVSTATELDRESIAMHSLTITASDGRTEAVETIQVVVVDVNDNEPVFSEEDYAVTIVENVPSGSSVVTLVATDRDEGRNGDITYSKTGGDINVFDLDSSSGAIRTQQALDYETQSQYTLIVTATDNGISPLTSVVEVNITVEDFNDFPPTFLNPPSSVTVSENAAAGSILADFNVTDGDSGPRGVAGARFSIIAGDTALFAINPVSGILTTRVVLDREQGPECRVLSIQAIDSAGENSRFATTEIEVCVSDVNDNCPVFSEPSFSISVPEDEALGNDLLTVQATDRDSGSNGEVEYTLLEDGDVFEIAAATGGLSLTATLDKETLDSYQLVVEVCDRGDEPCCSNTTVAVTVEDVNDNKPIINNIPDMCVDVLETGVCADEVKTVGDVVFTLNATDADTGLSGTVFFPPLADTSLPFELSVAGVITISAPLDYETEQEYTLILTAQDHGSPQPQISDTAVLCVRIVDINDNPPVFTSAPYAIFQREGPLPTSPLVLNRLVAMDNDQTGTPNAEIEYSIVSGNTSVFSLDPSTGDISLLMELDCEAVSSFSLTVLANNSLSACPLATQASVVVTVIDVNDNAPVFDQQLYEMNITEDAPTNTLVVVVSATDADKTSPNNALLYRYVLGSGPNPFHLDQDTGSLTVQNPLDLEMHPDPYELTVVVEDKGEVPLSSSATVRITLLDVNDEPPRFSEDTFSAEVSEGETVYPHLVLPLAYTDDDALAENRASVFEVTSISARHPDGSTSSLDPVSGPFSIDGDQLNLRQVVDRETVMTYDVTVAVRNSNPVCSSPDGCQDSAVVTLTVIDVNDNAPCFPVSSYSGEVSVTAPPGTLVLTVAASDADSGNFGEIRYELVDTDGRFRIDDETGNIFTRGSFERLDGQRLTVRVTAYDNLGSSPSLTCGTTVELVVLNDFQRIRVLFSCGIDEIIAAEDTIVGLIEEVSGLTVQVEPYSDYSTDTATNFIFHAIHPTTNEIVDFDEFFQMLQEDGEVAGINKEQELITKLAQICSVDQISAFADISQYSYPDPLDTQTIVILVLCLLLIVGAVVCLLLSIRQRWVALHDTRSKLLADVFYGSPGSTSLVENVQQENYQLEEFEMKENRQNPMFVQPYDNWEGLEASGAESTGDMSSLRRDNPLYESQEIRMEMFADVSDTEGEGDEADDAELLAAALKDDEEPEDNSVTAI